MRSRSPADDVQRSAEFEPARGASAEPFVASARWSPDRPRTLVVCCSDGRWHAAMMEFVRREVDDHADLYAVPGGPAVFDPWSSSFDEARALESSLRLFAEHHDLHAIWLIAHDGCAHYKVRHPSDDEARIQERQEVDLRTARAMLRSRFPRLDVRMIHAAREGERIAFHTLPPSDAVPAASLSFSAFDDSPAQ